MKPEPSRSEGDLLLCVLGKKKKITPAGFRGGRRRPTFLACLSAGTLHHSEATLDALNTCCVNDG